MAIVAPPPGPPPTGTAGGSGAVTQAVLQALGEVVVEQVPDRIAQLARTIILSGTVIAQQAGGALVLRTQVGELIIRSQTPLPLDKILTLQIPPGAPPVRAQVSVVQAVLEAVPQPAIPAPPPVASASPAVPVLTPVSGKPVTAPSVSRVPVPTPVITAPAVPAPAPVPAKVPAGVTINPTALQAITELPLLPGSVIPAQVLAVPEYGEAQVTARLVLPPVVEMLAELQRMGAPALKALIPQGLAEVVAKLPPAVLSPLPAEAATQVRQSPAPAAPLPALQSPPAFASLPVLLTLPPGAQVTVQIVEVTPPPVADAKAPVPPPAAPQAQATSVPATMAAPPSAPAAVAEVAAPTFTSVVVGHTVQREPIATSPAGLFVLDSKSPLPVGSKVELSLVHVIDPVPEAEAVVVSRAPRDWSVLQQALAVLGPAVPTQTTARLTRPEAVGSSVLFLMAALRLGNVQKYLGAEAVEVLQARGQAELLTRLNAEFQQVGQGFNRPDAPATEWRTLMLPLLPHGQISRMAIHTRQEREAADTSGPLAVKRLVVELELSRLGPMLLDGYIRQKKFDITLRSQRRLDKSLKDELRLAYRDTLTALGWNGSMEFQTAAELWLEG